MVKKKGLSKKSRTVTKKLPRQAKPVLPIPWNEPCSSRLSQEPTVADLQILADDYGMDVTGINWTLPVSQICQQLSTRWPKSCVSSGFFPTKVLATGASGLVLLLCRKRKCNRVLKLQLPQRPGSKEEVLYEDQQAIYPITHQELIEEVQFQKMAYPMAPEIFRHGYCILPRGRQVYVIEMEKMDGTWWELFPKEVVLVEGDKLNARGLEFIEPVFRLLNQFHEKGLIHGDLHSSNVFYKLNLETGLTTPVFGDFGASYPVPKDDADKHKTEDFVYFLLVESYRFPDDMYTNLNMQQLKDILIRTGTPTGVTNRILSRFNPT